MSSRSGDSAMCCQSFRGVLSDLPDSNTTSHLSKCQVILTNQIGKSDNKGAIICKENLTIMKKYFLPQWTEKILTDTGWSQTELATRAGLSRTSINDVINGKVKGGYKFAISVAEAANRPIEEGLQAAGIMDIPPDNDPKRQELIHISNQMTDSSLEDTIDYARMKLQKQDREDNKSEKRKKVA